MHDLMQIRWTALLVLLSHFIAIEVIHRLQDVASADNSHARRSRQSCSDKKPTSICRPCIYCDKRRICEVVIAAKFKLRV